MVSVKHSGTKKDTNNKIAQDIACFSLMVGEEGDAWQCENWNPITDPAETSAALFLTDSEFGRISYSRLRQPSSLN